MANKNFVVKNGLTVAGVEIVSESGQVNAEAIDLSGIGDSVLPLLSASGDISYDSETGVFSYTERTDSEIRSLFSAGGDLSYDSATGTFTVTNYGTSDFDADFGNQSTDDLSEGTTNLYYSDALVDAHVTGGTGVDYTSGTISIGQDVAADQNVLFKTVAVTDPVTSSNHLATKQYVDEVAQGLTTLPSARAATTGDLSATYNNGSGGIGATLTATTNGTISIDDVALSLDDNVLVKDQSDPAENGSYVVTNVGNGSNPWVLTRCEFCDELDDIAGSFEFVYDGTQNANTGWVLGINDSSNFTIGTDNINVTQFSGAGTYTAGNGLDLTGTTFSVNAGAGLELANDNIQLASSAAGNGLTYASGALAHADTSTQNSVNNTGNTVIQDITLDDYGHITSLGSTTITAPNNSTITLTAGNGLTGGGNFTTDQSINETISFSVDANAIGADELNVSGNGSTSNFLRSNADGSFVWDTPVDTQPNDVTITLSAGAGLAGGGNFTTDQGNAETITFDHADTSTQPSVNNTGSTVIQGVTVDTYGHVTGLSSATIEEYSDSKVQTKLGSVSGNILPDTDITYDIGSSSLRFRDLYLSGTTIDLAGTKISTDSNGDVEFKDASNNPRKVIASEIEVGDASEKIRIGRSNNGRVFFERFNPSNSQIIDTTETANTADIPDNLSDLTINSDTDFGSNKIFYANVFSTLGDLPSASTYHGMFAHVHGEGKAYYSHAGNWVELANQSAIPNGLENLSDPNDDRIVFWDNTSNQLEWLDLGSNISISGNTLNVNVDGGNATTLDGIDSTSFLRSDTTDYKTSGSTRYNDNIELYFGSSNDVKMVFNGSAFYTDIINNDDWYIQDSGTNRFLFDISVGDFHADGDIIGFSTSVSDERLKENIQGIDSPLDKLSMINGVSFDYKHNGKRSAGVIAQQIEQVMPEAVDEKALPLITGSEDDLYKTVEYDALHALLIEAVKELKGEVNELKKRLGD